MTPTDPKKAEEVALFRTYLTSKLAADMREWWYVHWAMDEDDTNAAALELALILKLNQGGLPGRFLDRCPIFTDLFKSLWRSIRHHSQRTESMFNLIDNTNLNAKGMSWERLVARVLAKAHYTRVWQAERRAAHVRKISPDDEDEQKGKISKKPRLQNNAAACQMAARQVVALKDTYTSSIMKEVRTTSRPQWYRSRPGAKRQLPKKPAKENPYVEEHVKLKAHWDGQGKDRSAPYQPMADAVKVDFKKKKVAQLQALKKAEMAGNLFAWNSDQDGNDPKDKVRILKLINARYNAAEIKQRWEEACGEQGLDHDQIVELWEGHLAARAPKTANRTPQASSTAPPTCSTCAVERARCQHDRWADKCKDCKADLSSGI